MNQANTRVSLHQTHEFTAMQDGAAWCSRFMLELIMTKVGMPRQAFSGCRVHAGMQGVFFLPEIRLKFDMFDITRSIWSTSRHKIEDPSLLTSKTLPTKLDMMFKHDHTESYSLMFYDAGKTSSSH